MINKKPGIFSVIALNIGTMVGSGWLFAPLHVAQVAGGAAILAWIIGALLALCLSLLLAEIAIKYPVNALFTRIISLSHNPHFGSVTALANWILGLIIVPSEAIATTQYLSSAYPAWSNLFFAAGNLTWLGVLITIFFIFIYFMINYFGIKFLSRINNVIAFAKFVIPIFSALIIAAAAFHTQNFTVYRHQFMPYGTSSIFTAITTSGIFYSFFGFQIAATFTAELDNPKRNIPIALASSVILVLVIYLLVQIAFIGALPTALIGQGWQTLDFQSPFVYLTGLLGLNFLTVILYADSGLSPGGTGLVYLGATARMLNSMVKLKQAPAMLGNASVNFSKRALFVSFVAGAVLVVFFRNWALIAKFISTFILIACAALPVAYARISGTDGTLEVKLLPFAKTISLVSFLTLSYLLILVGTSDLAIALVVHLTFFTFYAYSRTRKLAQFYRYFASAWTIFVYLVTALLFAYWLNTANAHSWYAYMIFLLVNTVLYSALIGQKSYIDT